MIFKGSKKDLGPHEPTIGRLHIKEFKDTISKGGLVVPVGDLRKNVMKATVVAICPDDGPGIALHDAGDAAGHGIKVDDIVYLARLGCMPLEKKDEYICHLGDINCIRRVGGG